MKRSLYIIRPLALCLSALSSAETGDASPLPQARGPQGEITAVTLLSDRAEITRTLQGRCQRSGGSVNVRFTQLPQGLQAKTLRAEVSRGAEVIGVSLSPPQEQPVTSAEQSPKHKALQAEFAKLQAERQRVERRLSTLSKRAQVSTQAARRQITRGGLNTQLLTRLINERRAERLKLTVTLAELNHKRQALQAELRQLSDQEASAQQQKRLQLHSSGDATVSLTCQSSGQRIVTLSYVTSGASWSPEYHVSFKHKRGRATGKMTVKWGVNAVIRQATGEDWTGVSLTLSTAQPNLGDFAPLPAPLKVYGEEYQQPKVLTQRGSDRARLESGATNEGAPPQAVALEDRGQSFALKVPTAVTIEAHGRPYWVPVSVTKGAGEVSLVSVPSLSPHVYRVARFDNPAPHPLPAAPVSLIVNGALIGQRSLPYTGIGAPLELSLGVEEGLKVARELEEVDEETSGLINRDRELLRRFKVTLLSASDKAQRVELIERLPISEVSALKVQLNSKLTTEGFKRDKQRGFLTWSLKLKALEERQVRYAYQLTLPEDWKMK